MKIRFGIESQNFRRALKMRKRGARYDEIAQELKLPIDLITAWIEGRAFPSDMHPNMAEQWRQSSLFGFSKPFEHYKGRGL